MLQYNYGMYTKTVKLRKRQKGQCCEIRGGGQEMAASARYQLCLDYYFRFCTFFIKHLGQLHLFSQGCSGIDGTFCNCKPWGSFLLFFLYEKTFYIYIVCLNYLF